MSRYPEEILDKLKVLQRADILAHSPLGQTRIERLEELNAISEDLKASGAVFDIKGLAIDGRDIISLGVKEGPVIGEILGEVFKRYVDGECVNTKDSLLGEAKKILQQRTV